jgi:hypothetical protein
VAKVMSAVSPGLSAVSSAMTYSPAFLARFNAR